jgi:hypothetical protein
MTKEQINAVFMKFDPRIAGVPPPRQLTAILLNGQMFSGMTYPADKDGLILMQVDRIHDAHLTKPRINVWFPVESVLALTDGGEVVIRPRADEPENTSTRQQEDTKP